MFATRNGRWFTQTSSRWHSNYFYPGRQWQGIPDVDYTFTNSPAMMEKHVGLYGALRIEP